MILLLTVQAKKNTPFFKQKPKNEEMHSVLPKALMSCSMYLEFPKKSLWDVIESL